MIKELLDQLMATWPTEIEALAMAVAMAGPWVLFFAGIWYAARGGQWLIDRYTVPRRGGMRTADERQIEREVAQLWQPWHDTVPPPTPQQQQWQQHRRRVRAGQPVDAPPQTTPTIDRAA